MKNEKVLEIIDSNFITKHRSPAKLKAVAKASSKFINKYKGKHNVDYNNVIGGCLESYCTSLESGWEHAYQSLEGYLEDNKSIFFIK